MTTQERVERLREIEAELLALTTALERSTYPALDHLADLIEDLEAPAD